MKMNLHSTLWEDEKIVLKRKRKSQDKPPRLRKRRLGGFSFTFQRIFQTSR